MPTGRSLRSLHSLRAHIFLVSARRRSLQAVSFVFCNELRLVTNNGIPSCVCSLRLFEQHPGWVDTGIRLAESNDVNAGWDIAVYMRYNSMSSSNP